MSDDYQARLEDYVEVPERIQEFFEKHPEGSLQSAEGSPQFMEFGGKQWIVYRALAFRTPDDLRPGVGMAWEPVPGATPYTKDSELMNAETSAWGRALVALGFVARKNGENVPPDAPPPKPKVASANEVRARQTRSQSSNGPQKTSPALSGEFASEKQQKMLWAVAQGNNGRGLSAEEAQAILMEHIGVPDYSQVPKSQVDRAKHALQTAPVIPSDVPAPDLPEPEQEDPEDIPF